MITLIISTNQNYLSYFFFFFLGYNKINKTYPKSIAEMVEIITDAFNSAAERDIYTGKIFKLRFHYKNNKSFYKIYFEYIYFISPSFFYNKCIKNA